MNSSRIRRAAGKAGWRAFLYALLVAVSYVYLYPVLYMAVNSLKGVDDLLDPMVRWIPHRLSLANYAKAARVLDFVPSLLRSIVASALPALLQSLACAVTGYGFARFLFPGRLPLLGMAIAVFMIPPQVTMIPQFLLFKDLHLLGSVLSFSIPALLAQGIRSSVFILLFYQFVRSLPRSLEESAQIDGAGRLGIFLRVVVPLLGPAFLVSFLFSLVWYWNESLLAGLYFGETFPTLPVQLERFASAFEKIYPQGSTGAVDRINEAVKMAGTFLSILPLLATYAALQRQFVLGIDRTGITGE